MEKKRTSLILHFDSLDVIDELNDNQLAELFKAIRYYNLGKEVKLNGLMKAIFIPFKNQFDRDLEKYNKKCEVNADNIKKRWNKKDTTDTSGTNGIKKDTKDTYNDSKSDSDSDNKKDNKSISIKESNELIATKVATLENYIKKDFTLEFITEVYNKYGMSKNDFQEECESFVLYWKEKNPNGKKEKWEKEKTFDPKLRFRNWIKNSKKWSNTIIINGEDEERKKKLAELEEKKKNLFANLKTNVK